MCDFGRGTFRPWELESRPTTPRMRGANGSSELVPTTWSAALERVAAALRDGDGAEAAFVASGQATTEEAFLLARAAATVGSPHRYACVRTGPRRAIPTVHGETAGTDAQPNRRGAALAGLEVVDVDELARRLRPEGAASAPPSVLFVLAPDFGELDEDAGFLQSLFRADLLVVAAWERGPLTDAADVLLPLATIAEKDGTLVNVQGRMQRVQAAFPARGEARSGVDLLIDLLAGLDAGESAASVDEVFELVAAGRRELAGATLAGLPADGVPLDIPEVAAHSADAGGSSPEE